MMPESIIVPSFDPNYDLAYLTPLQLFLAPYEVWWELCLWTVFAFALAFKIYQYLIYPYLYDTE
ncbi:hypothetical protein GW756_04015 [bacterium]|nr:hypothetical protein [bacterium]NCQ55233.1 hypothetical protein [Candidatus Parcubacteria bacterium]NCS67254.1 hypothetical protein [Candidatus Peregrinibacteria bacterium]NCS96509.1 hypothetical protein [bacterium]